MSKNTGARYEIAVDGRAVSYRDVKATAIEAATYLKTKSPHVEITVRDVERSETIVVRHPQAR